MTTDDTEPGDLSNLKDPRYGELSQDHLVPSQMRAGDPELDNYGVPVQDRSARGRAYLQEIACLICGTACFGLALTDYNGDAKHRLTSYQTALALLPGILAFVLSLFALRGEKEKQLGAVGKGMVVTGMLLALIGVIGLITITWPNVNWGD